MNIRYLALKSALIPRKQKDFSKNETSNFKSVLEQDRAPVVLCDLEHVKKSSNIVKASNRVL